MVNLALGLNLYEVVIEFHMLRSAGQKFPTGSGDTIGQLVDGYETLLQVQQNKVGKGFSRVKTRKPRLLNGSFSIMSIESIITALADGTGEERKKLLKCQTLMKLIFAKMTSKLADFVKNDHLVDFIGTNEDKVIELTKSIGEKCLLSYRQSSAKDSPWKVHSEFLLNAFAESVKVFSLKASEEATEEFLDACALIVKDDMTLDRIEEANHNSVKVLNAYFCECLREMLSKSGLSHGISNFRNRFCFNQAVYSYSK